MAGLLPGRLGKQCRERWCNHLDPSVKKTKWTPHEDEVLFNAQVWMHRDVSSVFVFYQYCMSLYLPRPYRREWCGNAFVRWMSLMWVQFHVFRRCVPSLGGDGLALC